MIYIDHNLGAYSEKDLQDMLPELSEERIEKISRLACFEDRLRSAVAFLLLKRGLQIEYGNRFNKIPRWDYGSFGKPYLADYPEIHFNLSHCEKVVVCAISSTPIGIDVETIKIFDEDLARYITSDQEFDDIMKAPDPALAFTILWTKKESFCKLTGKGLDSRESIIGIIDSCKARFQTQVNIHSGYVMSTCQMDY